MPIERSLPSDAAGVLALYRSAYRSEAELYNDWTLPPLVETVEHLVATHDESTILIQRRDGNIIGTVRGQLRDGIVLVGRLAVDPAFQGLGMGTRLLAAIETWFSDVATFELFTGHLSEANIRLYERVGYREVRRERVTDAIEHVYMRKSTQS